jgi:hypothetical protein
MTMLDQSTAPQSLPALAPAKRSVSRRNFLRTAGVVAGVGAVVAGATASKWAFGGTAGATTVAAGATRAAAGIKPDASNTGVLPGSVLTQHQGDLIITTAGTVVQNQEILGNVIVRASNVTLRNCIIRGATTPPTSGSYALILQSSNSNTGLVVEDCTLVSQSPNNWTVGVQGCNFTMRRCDVSATVDGIDVSGAGNVLVDSCYIHDGNYFTPSATNNDNQTHNYITRFAMSCFMIGQDQGPITNLRIVNNWLDGGTAQVNINAKSRGTMTPVITGNRFGRSRRNTYQMLLTGTIDRSSISNNVWDDNGQAINITVQ